MQRKFDLSSTKLRLISLLGLLVATVFVVIWILMPPRMNVLLVTFDTTRADRLGIYGYADGLTEALDQFARQGVVFENAYAPAPLTLPSHTTMLTGLHPPEHGLHVNGSGRLGDAAPLLQEILKDHGYDTGAFLAAFVLNSKFGLNRGFDLYDDDLSDSELEGDHSFDRRRSGVRVVDSALDWLGKRTSKPFFCWVHLYDAHAPYDPREATFADQFKKHPYDAGIAVEVQQFKRLWDFLEHQKRRDRTIVIVAGDHGEGLGEHHEVEHGSLLYNSTLRVPLIISAPGQSHSGHRVAPAVSLIDIAPTVLDLLGITIPKVMRGKSLRSSVEGNPFQGHTCYAETEAPFLDNRWCPMQAIITDRWKYIYSTKSELFDLQNDPGELVNLLDTAVEQRKEMHAMLEELQVSFVPLSPGNVHLSQKDRQILGSLGYIGGRTDGSTSAMNNETLPDVKEMLPFQIKLDGIRDLMGQGDLSQAEVLARELVADTVPRFPTAEVTLGDILRKQEKFQESEEVYQATLNRRPDCIMAHARLADLYASLGRWHDASKQYRAVVKLEPEASQAHFDLGQTLFRMGGYDEALMEYKEAIRSDPGFVSAHFEIAMLLAKSRRFRESIYYFEQALKYEPSLVAAHMNLSGVLLQLKEYEKAREHAEKAVEIEPESFETHLNLGTLLMSQDRFEEALLQLRHAHRLNPEDPITKDKIRQLEAELRSVKR